MLVLRKEIKMGLGIGAAVLGIAAVYGLMATLSSSNGNHSQTGTDTVATSTDGPHGLDSAVTGLPPKDDGSTVATNSNPSNNITKPVTPTAPDNDPFAEHNRTDGAKSDPWTLALATGKVNTDTKTVADTGNDGPLVVMPPNAPQTDPPLKLGDNPATPNRPRVIADPLPPSQLAGNGTTPKSASTGGSTYVVQSGDTFSTIAAKTLGSKRYYMLIAKANPSVDPRRMRVGTEITIPAKEAVANVSGAVDTATHSTLTRTADSSHQYTVAAGDTLHRIALKLYGKSGMWESIYDANKTTIGPDAGRLKIGMVLTLPKATTHAS